MRCLLITHAHAHAQGDDNWDVESILDARVSKTGGLEYRIKWLGFALKGPCVPLSSGFVFPAVVRWSPRVSCCCCSLPS
jgi:hypothetical protein